MSERQRHGLDYERYISSRYPAIVPSTSYTAKWDATLGDLDVSIKTKRLGSSIEMGSLFRCSEIRDDFYLFVGMWSGRRNNIVHNYTVRVPGDYFARQLDLELVERARHVFDGISNSRSDDARWKERMNDELARWASGDSDINVHFKRDHKKQKRVQCSIKYDRFLNNLVEHHSVVL